ncbi:MAG: hypothetical protein GY856_27150 [bacterium]|nr:hypothetical protein [bacterium]
MAGTAATTFDRLRHYFNRCKPEVPIAAGAPEDWYVDFDAQNLRGERCTAVLESVVRLTEGPTCQLFTGFPGSGKTSELLRLVGRLENRGYLVVYADALDTIDGHHPIESSDVLLTLGLAVDQKLSQIERIGTSSRWLNRFANEIKDLLLSNVSLQKFALKMGSGGLAAGELALELKANPSFRRHLREAANQRRRQLLDQVQGYFTDVDAKARMSDYPGGVVVILDNLEKLSPDPDVRDSARSMFLHQVDALRTPGIHLIYTIPPALVFSSSGSQLGRLYDGEPQVLPMVKVRDRPSEVVFREGHEALRELLARRLDFEEVFGGRQDLVDVLVTHCGGYARDLLRLTQYSLQIAGDLPLDAEHVTAACTKLRKSYERAYSTADLPLLRYVGAHRPRKVPEEHQDRMEDVITGHFILIYGNDSEWYDLHPLVAQVLEAVAAEAAAEESETAGHALRSPV